jgi:hypothetical protein
MRLVKGIVVAAAVALVVPVLHGAPQGRDMDRAVPGGGIFVDGWKGRIDPGSVRQGRSINDSKFAKEGDKIVLTIGPAAVYWNPENMATGDYTVQATFEEPKYMSANDHPHPYGLFIGGHNMDSTDKLSLVYCEPYGNGTFIVRGFNPTAPRGVFSLQSQAPNPAIHKAAGVGQPVTQEVAWTVKGGTASCLINGKVVASYTRAQLVAPDKIESTDGIWGIRISHNLDVIVTGLKMTKG